MIQQRKRQNSHDNRFAGLWNEILFAREFEYETPLSPDEMASALKAIEALEHRSRILSGVTLKHQLEIERVGDKLSSFRIQLAEDKQAKWSSKMTLIYCEVSVKAESETGLSQVVGRTRFSAQYYLMWLGMFAMYILTGLGGWMTWFWLGSGLLFWLAMYYERNAFADRLDDIIMHAKSERSIAALMGEEDDKVDNSDMLEANTVLSNLGTKER